MISAKQKYPRRFWLRSLRAARAKPNTTPLLALSLCALLGLTPTTLLAADTAPDRGSQTLARYKSELQAALRSGMSKGVNEAIAACQVQAPGIAAKLSRDGVRVGRASHRLRNPANVAPAWVEPVLESYLANPDNRQPRRITLSAGQYGYAEPIVMQPLCTTCHGNAIPDAISARIRQLYPEDQAVGFKEGDLRGVFWVEYPAGH